MIFAPLLHGGPDHLLANTPPLLVAGTTMLYLYPRSSPARWQQCISVRDCGVGAGPLVDVSRSEWTGLRTCQLHLRRGPARRDRRAIAASLLVCFMYGALVWGIFRSTAGSPGNAFAAAVIGAGWRSSCGASIFRRADAMPGKTRTRRWTERVRFRRDPWGRMRPTGEVDERFKSHAWKACLG